MVITPSDGFSIVDPNDNYPGSSQTARHAVDDWVDQLLTYSTLVIRLVQDAVSACVLYAIRCVHCCCDVITWK